MDYVIYSVDDVDTASSYASICIDICRRGGFVLRQFMSDSREVFHQLHPEQLSKPTLNLSSDSLPVEKLLGF